MNWFGYVNHDRLPFRKIRWSRGLVVTAIPAIVLAVGYFVVAITIGDRRFPGGGFLVLAAVGLVGLASLVDALRPGDARRSALEHRQVEREPLNGSDERRP